ncbi:MAG TPA: class I SAM-dependent methyltransferase [Flavitalea sp.]|nr:class I SAM-dependent methyltransferase [Flavitalea sp.]
MSLNSTSRFSNRVENYVKYRPGYPVGIIQYLIDNYNLTTDKKLADIGSGTGISAEMFLLHGFAVAAVEPNAEMREKSVQLLQKYSSFAAVNGTAENTNLDANSVDAVICGQSFHWFDHEKCKIEFKRVLKPGGIVVIIWNERKTSSAFEIDYEDLIIKHGSDYKKVTQRNIDPKDIAIFFHPSTNRIKTFFNQQLFDFDGLLGRLLSSSYMPTEHDEGFDEMKKDLRLLFDKYEENGQIKIEYDTRVYSGQL